MRRRKDEPLVYDGLEELLEILAEERRKSLKKRKRVFVGISIYISAILLLMIVMALSHGNPSGMLGQIGSITAILAGAYAATQKQQKAVQALAQFDDVRAVPRLIEMLEYTNKGLKTDAANILLKLLPKLQNSDAALLTQEHHAILNRALTGKVALDKAWRQQMQVAILNALQQVGNESSLPIVEELAAGKGKAKDNAVVQQAAGECLPFLQTRVAGQRQMQTLLRASDGNVTSADVLLRSAASRAEAHPEELLRAAPSTAVELPEQKLPEQAFVIHAPASQEEALPLRMS